jgi:hypothetical protein
MWLFLSCRMPPRNSSRQYINFDNQPYDKISKDFEECSITIPLHHQYVSLKIDHNHSDDVNLIRNSLALHVGLSIVENILLRCDYVSYWLKDHFFPKHNVLFKDEIVSLFFTRSILIVISVFDGR